jgi:hypothetical protein
MRRPSRLDLVANGSTWRNEAGARHGSYGAGAGPPDPVLQAALAYIREAKAAEAALDVARVR